MDFFLETYIGATSSLSKLERILAILPLLSKLHFSSYLMILKLSGLITKHRGSANRDVMMRLNGLDKYQ